MPHYSFLFLYIWNVYLRSKRERRSRYLAEHKLARNVSVGFATNR